LSPLTFTLLSDGSSDRALIPVLEWLLQSNSGQDFDSQWADLRSLRQSPRTLAERIRATQALYPCDLLFVHRDAERESREMRLAEIRRALGEVLTPAAVCVIPVRMQEAWLLIDEGALRLAADNPRGRRALNMPSLERLEELPDPKDTLYGLLVEASGLRPGRLHSFHPAERVHRMANLITDFSPLRRLPAFRALEEDLKAVLDECRWR
jgi:hypothetical protein